MSDDGNAVSLRLINDCEVGVTRKTVIHFDAIRAALFQPVNCLPTFSGSADNDSWTMSRRLRTVNNGTAGDDSRSQELSGSDLSSPAKQVFQLATHVPDTRH